MGSSFDAAQESHKHMCPEVARLESDLFEARQAVLREGLEVERLRAEKAELIQAKVDLRAAFDAQVNRASLAEREVERLRTLIREALNELGVPNENYPSPVWNAVEALRHTFEGSE